MGLPYNPGKWSPEVSSRGNVSLPAPHEVFSGGGERGHTFLISANWPHDKEWVVRLSLSFFKESLQASKGENHPSFFGESGRGLSITVL